MRSSVRKSLYLMAVLAAVMTVLIGTTVPAGALNPAAGAGGTIVSPRLKGHKVFSSINGQWCGDVPTPLGCPPAADSNLGPGYDAQGFPCAGGGGPVLDAFQKFVNGGAAYSCFGDLYSSFPVPVIGSLQSQSAFSGSGVDLVTGYPFSFAGSGPISGSYTYSEPCQDVDGPGGAPAEAGTGEAIGTLTISATGSGVVVVGLTPTPITSGTISVDFWWSRVGLTAVVGLKNITITSAVGTFTDPDARGLANAVFIPFSSPNCAAVAVPPAGNIVIVSSTLSVG